MRDLFKRNITELVVLILIGLLNTGCSENLTPPIDDNSIDIEFPIGKKAVYAVGSHEGDKDSDTLEMLSISIFSLQFDSVITKTNAIEYIGQVVCYNSNLLENDSSEYVPIGGQYAGNIVVSIDDKWVLFQESEVMGSAQIFMKRASTETDTTEIPTLHYNQFPVLPKRITPNTFYSAYRPNDDSLHFLSVQRDFDVKEYVKFSDIYGMNEGLFYSTEQTLFIGNNFTLNYNGIIDSKGVVSSTTSVEWIIIGSSSPEPIDTVTQHLVNRRIVDFTEPENVKDLSWYSKYVIENGLELLGEL